MTARRALPAWLICAALAGCGSLPGLENPEQSAPEQPAAEQSAPEQVASVPPSSRPQPDARRPASEIDELLAYFQHVRKMPVAELGREHDAVRQAFLYSRSDFDRVRLAMLLSLPGTPIADEPRALELLDPVVKNPGGKFSGLAVLLASNLQERKRLDANAQGLQQKLDALMLLERNMIERKR
jgi:hypothetical protein